jgi:Tol biopolymer transport system component
VRVSARFLATTAVILAVAAGCTEAPGRDLPDVDVDGTRTPAASPSSGPAAGVPTTEGRLAVLDELGNLVTVRPDGSDEVLLAEAEAGRTTMRQPTWSPDGDRVAWVRLEADAAGTSSVLVTTGADGTQPTEAPTAVAPFYLSWDPTSSRVAYLGSSGGSEIELGIVDVDAGGGEAMPLDAGQPFYLSWAPSGDQMLVHVGEDRLDRLGLDGTLTAVGDRPGAFRAPAWTSDGRGLVYAAAATGDRQRLVVHDLDGQRAERLVDFEGSISFVLSGDGSRVAFQVVDGDGSVEPLSVVDRATGEIVPVTDDPAPAFFWSPDGDLLLYLIPEVHEGRVWARWGVWDGGSTFTMPRFYPSDVFGSEYLPFFDQYAQSMSLWAPDGSAFAYAGSSESGESGIWIQPARPDAEPVRVRDGVFVNWSSG